MATTLDDPTLLATRLSLQAVAEHVLAAALHAANGHIGLRQTPGGFGTPVFTAADGAARQLRVDGTDLVRTDDGRERRQPLTTVAAAAGLAGIEPGAPADVYTPHTSLEPERPLAIDAAAASHLADVFALANDALEQLRAAHDDEQPSIVQLWPEHFDLSTTLSEVNYGGSPGDAEHPRPYLYVGPFTLPDPEPEAEPFWNEPFGASRAVDERLTVADAVAFFDDGRTHLSS